jgi:hypothetical protein
MQPINYTEAFYDVMEALEPRTPTMVLHLEASPHLAHMDVRVVLNDSLTCEQVGEYIINPIHALRLLHHDMLFALDGELCERADFTVELYAVCNARFEREAAPAPATPEPALLTCDLSDLLDYILQAHTKASTSGFEVAVEGARWLVVR